MEHTRVGPADYINIQTGEVLDPDFKVFPPSRPWRFIVSVQGVRELLRSGPACATQVVTISVRPGLLLLRATKPKVASGVC